MRQGCDGRGPWAGGRGIGLRLGAVVVAVAWLTACAATTSRTTDDASTTTRVKIALLNDARVGGLRLGVTTFQGVVTVSGTVGSQSDLEQAIAVAKTVEGVREVRSALKVDGSQV